MMGVFVYLARDCERMEKKKKGKRERVTNQVDESHVDVFVHSSDVRGLYKLCTHGACFPLADEMIG